MPSRRWFVTTFLAVFSTFTARATFAADTKDAKAIGSGLPSSFDLKKQLETGLKARRPTDFEYIATIVDKVEKGELPQQLVDQAFLYARKKEQKVPIIYFQFSLKQLAQKAGVKL
jgi:hypothetical protein